jgi:hypothetical protein
VLGAAAAVSSSAGEMVGQVYQKSIYVSLRRIPQEDMFPIGWRGDIWMDAGEILERVHLRDQSAIWCKKDHFERVLPVCSQLLRQIVACFCTLVDIVNDDRSAHEFLIEPGDDRMI